MEAQGGSEVRRLHIIYFLSRKGSIEHPHLIRVHHLSKNGVRLRDVKRWLGELRGKEIPESFSWSYKRRYKTGYVWQDLLDDDLITPISDNEFVLKGSEISSPTTKDFSYIEEKVVKQKDQQEQKIECKEENKSHSSETSIYVSTKSSEIEEESPTFGSETSTLTDDSARLDMEKASATTKVEKDDKTERFSPFYSPFFSKKSKKKSNKVTIDEKNITTPIDDPCKTSSSEPQCTKSKSTHSTNATQRLRNLITCRDVDTNDAATVAVKPSKSLLSMCSNDVGNVHSSEICKRDMFGGSQRVFGTPNWTNQEFSGRKSFDGAKESAKRASSAAYKPVNRPNCSQCGKNFKPEKLHAHMKSCKGLKALLKGAADAAVSAAVDKATKGSRNGDFVSGNLLTH